MWWVPSRVDFKLAEGIQDTHAGKLVGRTMGEIEKLKEELVKEAERVMTEIEGEKGDKAYSALVPGMGGSTSYMRHGWLSLSLYNAGFDETRLELAELQRACLEVKGMLNYYRWKRERYDRGHAIPSGEPEWCIGCFVDNVNAASMYWSMGIPVWLVRKKIDVFQSGIHIERPTETVRLPSHEEERIELAVQPNFPTIFTGSPKIAQHHERQQEHARMRQVIPTETPNGTVYEPISRLRGDRVAVTTIFRSIEEMAHDTRPESPEASSASRSTRSERFAPCEFLIPLDRDIEGTDLNADDKTAKKSKKGKGKASTQQVKVPTQEDNEIAACEIRAWVNAANNITTISEGNLKPQTFVFPPPALFHGPRFKTYMRNWLHIRLKWIGRMNRGEVGTIALKAQTWKDLLWFGFMGPNPNPPGDCRKIKNDLDQYAIETNADGTLTFSDGDRLWTPVSRYGDGSFETVQLLAEEGEIDLRKATPEQYDALCKDVMHELQELNFRFDLKRLDELLWKGQDMADERWARYNNVVECWEYGRSDRWCAMEGDRRRNTGLAADSVRERLPYLRSLFSLCEGWKIIILPQSLRRLLDQNIADDDAEKLEAMLVNALTQCSYAQLARPLLAPGRARPVTA